MLPSFLLALREGVEAALVVGILLGALRKLQRPELAGSVWSGVAAAGLASLLAAVGLNLAGASFEGRAEAIFEGVMMLTAAGLLTWMIFWMHHQARFLRAKIELDVRQAINKTDAGLGKRALFGVAFLAVFREGIELALFLVAAGMATNPGQTIAGAALGLAAAVGLGWLLFSSTRRLPMSKFFLVTNILLILFAAGLVSHGVHEFNEAGLIPSVVEHVYDVNPVLNEESTAGQLLKALFGYNGNPSLTEMISYLVYFAVLVLSVFRVQRQPAVGAAQG
jgi:high-affinity iron transporter